MALALDGSAHGNATSASVSVSLTTANPNDVIIIMITSNGSPVTGVTVGGNAATKRGAYTPSDIEEWYYIAPSALSAASVVATQTTSNFMTVDAFGISGANTSSPFDVNGGLPVTGGSDPLSISTSNTGSDFIFSAFRMSSTASPTQGSGWLKISGADFQLVEYQILSGPQSSLSASIGTGAGNGVGGIADAVVAGVGGGHPPLRTLMGVGLRDNLMDEIAGLWRRRPRLIVPGEPEFAI